MKSASIAALAGIAGVLATSLTALAADLEKGQVLAQRWCDSCHIVSERQTTGSTDAPPFSEIAEWPGLDAARVALFLLSPHPPMSGLNLSRTEAADLAAYILSRKSKGR